jgi:acetyl-CoA carboxylase biotin carboxylase subunit
LQRNHQKVLEESPAIVLDDRLRDRMTAAALDAARAAGYTNAGTVEFIVDGNGNFFFIEMNTRIQVEHPVTEMVTGINIVREQIRIASGRPLRVAQSDIRVQGHAIECRINAEDPEMAFRPSPGVIDYLHLPSGFGIRVDTVIHPGYEVSAFYDSLIAKIVVHGFTRNEAILRMRRALEETLITGISTNVGMHYLLMYNPDFISNRIDTTFLERNLEEILTAVKREMVL